MNLHKKVMHVELTVLKFEQKVFKLHIFKGTLAEHDIDPEQNLYYECCDGIFVLGTLKFSEKAKLTKLEIVKNSCYFIVPALEVAKGKFSLLQMFDAYIAEGDLIVFNPFTKKGKLIGVMESTKLPKNFDKDKKSASLAIDKALIEEKTKLKKELAVFSRRRSRPRETTLYL